jgi:circadian clock protein KaiC
MNKRKATINRLKTGVPGLDQILGGGLPEFSFNLISGTPGSGKTTLAHQIMFALASPSARLCTSQCLASRPSRCSATSSSSTSSTTKW